MIDRIEEALFSLLMVVTVVIVATGVLVIWLVCVPLRILEAGLRMVRALNVTGK